MDENERQEFSLEDIIKEFGGEPAEQPEEAAAPEMPPEETVEETAEEMNAQERTEETAAQETSARQPEEAAAEGDTVRLDKVAALGGDTVRLDRAVFAKGQVRCARPIEEEDEPEQIAAPKETEAFTAAWEPEYEQPMGEYVPPQPIIFRPRSRLHELKRKLVAGPEKRYYDLSEKGIGRLQAAMFLSLLVLLLSAGATAIYALGGVEANRMRLMVFGQFLAMLLAALLGAGQLIEGVADLLHGRFTLNTLLTITFAVCCADGVFCLQQLRVPCCAAFGLEMLMSLWCAHQEYNTEMGQMDTMRKAIRLDGILPVEDYHEGKTGLLRGEGQVEDFMDNYACAAGPRKLLDYYALGALVVSVAIGVTAGVLHGLSEGIQTAAASLLVALPATMFITLSRPMAILERRMHSLGTVLCGWQGVAGLSRKCVFPLDHEDLFPAGSIKMNGVKFFGSRDPDQVVAYTAAMVGATNSSLVPLMRQLLDSRNGRHYDAANVVRYEGGIGGNVEGETVLVGTLAFLKEMGVELPGGIRVSHAGCTAVNGELCGLFALTYQKVKASAAGLSALCAYRGLNPLLIADDFMLTGAFLRGRFGINPKKMVMPEFSARQELAQITPEPDTAALLLTTKEGLAPFACGVAGARALYSAGWVGAVIHMIGGIVGLGIMLALTLLGAIELLTPVRVLLYELVWMIPGLLITEWTRTL